MPLKVKTKFRGLIIFAVIFVLSLQATAQLSVIFIGLYQWVGISALIDLISHGFKLEIFNVATIVLLINIGFYGLYRGGFYRYLANHLLVVLIVMASLFTLGFLIFCTIYLDGIHMGRLLGVFALRFTSPLLWTHFIITQGVVFLCCALILAYYILEKMRPAHTALGNAHFSKGFEIQRDGFFRQKQESIIIGKKYGAPLYANGFEHVLVFAPTGSGKTRSIGIPNLFNYPYSIVCNDVKLTMFKTTSGFREQVLGHKCYCWAPASHERTTHRYNPLSAISKDKLQRITDIQRIAHILIPDNKKADPIWQQASRKLFKVALLYLLDTKDTSPTLGEINRLVKQASFDNWLSTQLEETQHLDPEFYRNGFSYLNNHEKTRGSILETFSGYFELFDDSMIDAATSTSDFELDNLRREKISIYIGFTDDDMERLSPLLTLFWQQLISVMIKNIPDPIEEPYPLLCLIDEFSSLGRIERLRRALKLLREYRVRCVLIMQYIAQTYEQYSHDEAKAFTNIKTKIAFAMDDMNDAEYLSKMLGMRTKRLTNRGISSQSGGNVSDNKNIHYQAIPLRRPDEIMKLPSKVALILRSGFSPIMATQFIWYKELSMKKLVQAPSSIPLQKIKQMDFEKSTAITDINLFD